MIGQDAQEIEKKLLSILKVLVDSSEPLGGRIIAHRLQDYGVAMGERTVRYHLKLMDERGLTRLVGKDGRLITERGAEELKDAMVGGKVGLAITRIELLAFRTNFDCAGRTGQIPVNVSFFKKEKFNKALQQMKPIFAAGLCVSDRVATANEGEKLGDLIVPEGCIGLATVCSIIINGALLKSGIPMDSRFGGILQIQDNKPFRFVELIHYSGSSMDPSEVFIRARMTSVKEAARNGNGKVLANFREIPALCRPTVEKVMLELEVAGISGLLLMGNTSEMICQIPVELNRVGMILYGGLNPVAAVEESGIEVKTHAMSTVMEYEDLIKIREL